MSQTPNASDPTELTQPSSGSQLAVTAKKIRPASEWTQLHDTYREVARLMVHGCDEPTIIEGELIEMCAPLTWRQAARVVGVRIARCREVVRTKLFQAELSRLQAAKKRSEGPRSLAAAIKIRDDEGDGSAATKLARLKAIQLIEGRNRSRVFTAHVRSPSPSAVPAQPATDVSKPARPDYIIRLRPEPSVQPEDGSNIADGEAQNQVEDNRP